MPIEPKELEIGELTTKVTPVNADLDDYELKVTTVSFEEGCEFNLITPVDWDDEEELVSEIKKTINGGKEWPETKDKDWTDHKLVEPGSKVWQVMVFVLQNPYCTSRTIEHNLEEIGSVDSPLYQAKARNLVKTVGKDGQLHKLAPTHLAYKEYEIDRQILDEEDKEEIDDWFHR